MGWQPKKRKRPGVTDLSPAFGTREHATQVRLDGPGRGAGVDAGDGGVDLGVDVHGLHRCRAGECWDAGEGEKAGSEREGFGEGRGPERGSVEGPAARSKRHPIFGRELDAR